MRRTWLYILIGAAVLAGLVTAMVVWGQTGAPTAPVTQGEAIQPPARNPTIFADQPSPAPAAPAPATTAVAAPTVANPPATPTPTVTPPPRPEPRRTTQPPPRPSPIPAPRPANEPVATPAPRPAVPPTAAATPAPRPVITPPVTPPPAAASANALARCDAPAEPAVPSTASAPSEDELNRFASAVERYGQQSERYRGCLDGLVRDTSLSENTRSEALRAGNASALRADALWEAYGAATDRYRSYQAEQARAAAERTQANRPPQP